MADITKLMIVGSQHNGTSILRTLLGRVPGVFEHPFEIYVIDHEILAEAEKQGCSHAVIKWPFTEDKYFEDPFYLDYVKIGIFRNPYYAVASINRRNKWHAAAQDEDFQRSHVYDYLRDVRCLQAHADQAHVVRYEDLFPNNFAGLRGLLHRLGLPYSPQILQPTGDSRVDPHVDPKEVLQSRPPPTEHERFRTWQINQLVRNRNDPAKLWSLFPAQIALLRQHEDFLQSLGYPFSDVAEHLPDAVQS